MVRLLVIGSHLLHPQFEEIGVSFESLLSLHLDIDPRVSGYIYIAWHQDPENFA